MKVKIKTLAWKQLSHSAWLDILPCSFSDVFVCNLWFLLIVRVRAVSASLHKPQLGGPRCRRGPKFSCRHRAQNSVPSPLSSQRKLRPSELKYEALEISEVGGPLKEKCLYITVTLGPFESKVFTHYNCCWGPLWKQSSALIHYSCCWTSLKAR